MLLKFFFFLDQKDLAFALHTFNLAKYSIHVQEMQRGPKLLAYSPPIYQLGLFLSPVHRVLELVSAFT